MRLQWRNQFWHNLDDGGAGKRCSEFVCGEDIQKTKQTKNSNGDGESRKRRKKRKKKKKKKERKSISSSLYIALIYM